MDESVEANVSNLTRVTSNTAAASSILGVLKSIIGVFVLSDEEKLEAGIASGDYHERLNALQIGEQPDPSETFRAKGRLG